MEIVGTLVLPQEPQSQLCLQSDDISASGAQEVGEVPGPRVLQNSSVLLFSMLEMGNPAWMEGLWRMMANWGPLGKDTSH